MIRLMGFRCWMASLTRMPGALIEVVRELLSESQERDYICPDCKAEPNWRSDDLKAWRDLTPDQVSRNAHAEYLRYMATLGKG